MISTVSAIHRDPYGPSSPASSLRATASEPCDTTASPCCIASAPRAMAAVLGCIAFALSGCAQDDGGTCTPDPYYHPALDPADFVAEVDNELWPLAPGTRWTYEGGEETIEVEVMTGTREVAGIECVVVHDEVFEGTDLVEDTYDWYAQDSLGNVWYMGEDSNEIEDGEVVSTEGSWEAGVDGAYPGYQMLADPLVALRYRQEYYACRAEDMAEITSLGVPVDVPAGSFTGCVEIHEWNELEDGSDEYKYFCPGVGLALEIDSEGVRVELTAMTRP